MVWLSAVATLIGLTACGSAGLTEEAENGSTKSSPTAVISNLVRTAPTPDPDLLATLSPGSVDIYDDEPASEYVSSDRVKLAVVGQVRAFAKGPEFPAGSKETRGMPSLVMAVDVSVVLKGDAPEGGVVYVNLLGARSVEQALRSAPKGAVVALYLEPRSMVDDPKELVLNRKAGRPPGEPLWFFGARGMVLATGAQGVAYPTLHEVESKVRFQDALPADLEARAEVVATE